MLSVSRSGYFSGLYKDGSSDLTKAAASPNFKESDGEAEDAVDFTFVATGPPNPRK